MNIFTRIKVMIKMTKNLKKVKKMTTEEKAIYVRNFVEEVRKSNNELLIEVINDMIEDYNKAVRRSYDTYIDILMTQASAFEYVINGEQFDDASKELSRGYLDEVNEKLEEVEFEIASNMI